MGYAYNRYALAIIRKHLGLRKGYIPKQLGIPVNTYYAWENGGMLDLNRLIDICNFLRISIYYFISIDENKVGPDDVVLPERAERANYTPTVFCHGAMSTYLNKERCMPIATICERANIGTPSYYLYFPKDSTKESIIQTDKYFRLCNVFKVWPGSFLTAHGEDIPCIEGYEEALVIKQGSSIRVMTQEEKNLLEMKRSIESASGKSSFSIDSLKQQYDELLESKLKIEQEKHERSRQRMSKRIKSLEQKNEQLKEQVADLKQQLKEARFYSINHSEAPYNAGLIAAEPCPNDDKA